MLNFYWQTVTLWNVKCSEAKRKAHWKQIKACFGDYFGRGKRRIKIILCLALLIHNMSAHYSALTLWTFLSKPLGHGHSRSVVNKGCSISFACQVRPVSIRRKQHQKHPTPRPLLLALKSAQLGLLDSALPCWRREGTGFGTRAWPPARDFLPCLRFPIPPLQESPQLLQTGTQVSLLGQALEKGRGLRHRTSVQIPPIPHSLPRVTQPFHEPWLPGKSSSPPCTTLLVKLPDFAFFTLARNTCICIRCYLDHYQFVRSMFNPWQSIWRFPLQKSALPFLLAP